jgi:predicted dehydrogenase
MKNVVILGTAHPHIYALAASIKKRTDARLAYVYDSNPQLCKESAEKIGAPAAASVEEALSCKPSLMITAAIPNERARLIEQSLAAGTPVLVDKPLAVTEAALNQIISAQKKYKLPVMVYYPYRGSAFTVAAKAALDAGRIGKLVRIFSAGPHKLNPASRPSWHFTRSENGGALIDIGSHHFDACLWFSGGSKPHVVSALHGNFDQPTKTEFQDFAQAQVQFSSGVLAHVEVDWLNPVSMKNFGDTRMWLQGTTGKIELRLGDAPQSAEIWTSQTAKEPLDTTGIPSMADWEDDLITALLNGTRTAIPQEDIWETSRLSLAAFESASMGGIPVKL